MAPLPQPSLMSVQSPKSMSLPAVVVTSHPMASRNSRMGCRCFVIHPSPTAAIPITRLSTTWDSHLPIGVPDTTTFSVANGFDLDADYYVIALVQHREKMNTSLPGDGTLNREYVQLETPQNASWSKSCCTSATI